MFWSNLFKNKNKIFNTEIVNNTSSKIPSFEELPTKEQEYVSNLKEEYLKFYENEDNYINLDNELFNEIKMYQDLALDIMHKDHFGNIVNSIIDSKKLAYYSQKITEINNTLKYKYIALNELRKDKKYLAKHMGLYVLGRRKINILKALDHQMNIINNMFVVADQKIIDYCTCAIANYPKNINENTKYVLENRYNKVEKDYKKLFNSSINLDDSISIADEITYMEILIDKFIYENKDLINKLKEQLDIIAFNEIIDEKEQRAKISNLKKIKMYYLIFYKYGRNLITKDDFNDLYQIIFNVYTYFIFKSDFISYYQTLNEGNEKSFYTNIVNSKVELFKMKKSPIFNANYLYSNDVYKCLTQILENSSVILNDEFNFSLLLSLEYEKGINNFFDFRAKNKIPNIFSDSNKYLRNEDYYKLVIGVYKYVEINKIKYNKEDSKSYFLNKYLTDKEIISYLVKKYDESKFKFELYELVNNINFNEFPKGIPSFCLDSIINYYNFNDRKPLIISDNYIDLYIRYYQPRVKDFIFNGNISNFHIILNQDFEESNMNTKFIIPVKTRKIIFESDTRIVRKYIPYLFDTPFYNINEMLSRKSYFLFEMKNSRFSKLGSMIVLKKDLLEYSEDRLFTHLITLFIDLEKSFIVAYKLDRNVKDSTTIRLFHEYMVNTWKDFFENITFIDDNGNIFKTNYFNYSDNNYSDNNYNDILSIIEDTYYYAIRFYVKSIKTQLFSDNYYEKANKKSVKYLKLY